MVELNLEKIMEGELVDFIFIGHDVALARKIVRNNREFALERWNLSLEQMNPNDLQVWKESIANGDTVYVHIDRPNREPYTEILNDVKARVFPDENRKKVPVVMIYMGKRR